MTDRLQISGGTVYLGTPGGSWEQIGTGVQFEVGPTSEPQAPEQPLLTAATFETTWDVELTEPAQRMFERIVEAARAAEEAVLTEALEKGWGVLQYADHAVDLHRDPEDFTCRAFVHSLATPLVPAGVRWCFPSAEAARRALGLDEEDLPDAPA